MKKTIETNESQDNITYNEKYNYLSKMIMDETNAELAIVIVKNGESGDGFSFHAINLHMLKGISQLLKDTVQKIDNSVIGNLRLTPQQDSKDR